MTSDCGRYPAWMLDEKMSHLALMEAVRCEGSILRISRRTRNWMVDMNAAAAKKGKA